MVANGMVKVAQNYANDRSQLSSVVKAAKGPFKSAKMEAKIKKDANFLVQMTMDFTK